MSCGATIVIGQLRFEKIESLPLTFQIPILTIKFKMTHVSSKTRGIL